MFDEFEDDELDFNLEDQIEILGEAYENAYRLITNKIDIADFLSEQTEQGKIVFLPFDPKAPETIDLILDDTIAYFEEGEEYEKCQELLKIKEIRSKDDTQ